MMNLKATPEFIIVYLCSIAFNYYLKNKRELSPQTLLQTANDN
jgi:hypothetical protein